MERARQTNFPIHWLLNPNLATPPGQLRILEDPVNSIVCLAEEIQDSASSIAVAAVMLSLCRPKSCVLESVLRESMAQYTRGRAFCIIQY